MLLTYLPARMDLELHPRECILIQDRMQLASATRTFPNAFVGYLGELQIVPTFLGSILPGQCHEMPLEF